MAYSKIKLRRGTAYDWNTIDPVLEEGEIVVECPDSGVGTGLSKFKIGDGTTPYSSLPYAFDGMRASSIDGGGAEKFNVIQIRGAKAATWESVNPILNSRELGFDMTHVSIKVGNGKNNWNDLPFIKASDFTGDEIDCGDEDHPEEDKTVDYEEDYDHDDVPPEPEPEPGPEPEPEPTPEPAVSGLKIMDESTSELIEGADVNGVWIYNINYAGMFDISMADDVATAINNRIIISAEDTVKLTFNDVVIDNSALDDDTPIISTNTNNNTNIYLLGDSTFTGNGGYTVSPARAVIVCNGEGDLFFYDNGTLTIIDPMDPTQDYSEVGMSGGVYCRGNISSQSTVHVISNGNAIEAGGSIHGYTDNCIVKSRLADGVVAAGDIVYDDSTVTIEAAVNGVNAIGNFVADGFAAIDITAFEPIVAASQNISDNATVTTHNPVNEGD